MSVILTRMFLLRPVTDQQKLITEFKQYKIFQMVLNKTL